MNDPTTALDSAADAAFVEMATAFNGAGADAGRAFAAVGAARAKLTAATSATEVILNTLLDSEDPAIRYMRPEEKAARIAQAQQAYAATSKQAAQEMNDALDIAESVAQAAALSDLERSADSAGRALTRSDIDAGIAGIKGSIFPALLAMAQRSHEMASELASGYAARLLQANGEGSMVSHLQTVLLAGLPGSTPKSRQAREALATLARKRGALSGHIYAGRARVENAAKPRPTDNPHRMDTLIQRRSR